MIFARTKSSLIKQLQNLRTGRQAVLIGDHRKTWEPLQALTVMGEKWSFQKILNRGKDDERFQWRVQEGTTRHCHSPRVFLKDSSVNSELGMVVCACNFSISGWGREEHEAILGYSVRAYLKIAHNKTVIVETGKWRDKIQSTHRLRITLDPEKLGLPKCWLTRISLKHWPKK